LHALAVYMLEFGEVVLMEQVLDVIQTLCRTALATGSPAVRQQVERLQDALGPVDARTATAIGRMLSRSTKTSELRPSRLTRAADFVRGEAMPEGVPMPVDRETSTPIVEIIRPAALPAIPPVLPEQLERSIAALLEEWANAAKLRDAGVAPVTTALIFGAPGTGKTQLALWIAGQLSLPVVLARLDGLISSFLGTTSRNIGSLFAFAERYQCLLLLDEFDAIAKMRDDPQEVGEIKRVVNTLLQNLDNRRLAGPTIAITNHESLLDPAIWRRFDVQIGLHVPPSSGRSMIIRRFEGPLSLTDAQVDFLVWCTEGASGSDVETLMRSLGRAYIIHGEPDAFNLVGATRRYVHINTGRLLRDRADLVLAEDHDLAQALRSWSDRFDALALSQLFAVHRTTAGRWLKGEHGENVRVRDRRRELLNA
jgi:hypothetical protein